MARLIKTDGTEEIVLPAGPKWTFKELQKHVGGYIEYMPSVGKLRMIMDEDGRMKGKPVNAKATKIVTECLTGRALRYQPVIVGDVLILDQGEKT